MPGSPWIVIESYGCEDSLHWVGEGPCAAVPCEPGCQLTEEGPLRHLVATEAFRQFVQVQVSQGSKKAL